LVQETSVCIFLDLGFSFHLEFRQYKFRSLPWFVCVNKLNLLYCLNKTFSSYSYVFSIDYNCFVDHLYHKTEIICKKRMIFKKKQGDFNFALESEGDFSRCRARISTTLSGLVSPVLVLGSYDKKIVLQWQPSWISNRHKKYIFGRVPTFQRIVQQCLLSNGSMVSDENNFYISLQYNPLLNLLCSGDHLGIKTTDIQDENNVSTKHYWCIGHLLENKTHSQVNK
jgi:hypothetical protein